MTRAVFLGSAAQIERVYGAGRREQALTRADFLCNVDGQPAVVGAGDLERFASKLAGVEAVFTTWGMPALSQEQIAQFLPRVRAVFYAAGSVQAWVRPFLTRGVQVCSAWQANAVPVAEYTLAQILLANKGYWQDTARCRTPEGAAEARKNRKMPGNYGATVVLLGAGAVGRAVVALLKAFHLRVLIWDPFLSQADAERLGVAKVETLAEAFTQGQVVSNHLADNAQTANLITGDLLARLPHSATFINTGRGRTVNEAELAAVYQARPDLTALLDVTHPEPPTPDSPLYALPNVHLTTHIAGSLGDEVVRMADYMLDEFERWQNGEPLRYAVSLELLATMA